MSGHLREAQGNLRGNLRRLLPTQVIVEVVKTRPTLNSLAESRGETEWRKNEPQSWFPRGLCEIAQVLKSFLMMSWSVSQTQVPEIKGRGYGAAVSLDARTGEF